MSAYGFAVDLVTQTIEKVIVPNVDPHPEEHGHRVLKGTFENAFESVTSI